jgi:hypothetical protein
MEIKIDLNEPKIIQKVTNDRFGTFVSQQWKKQIDPYTPKDTGALMGSIGQRVELLPFAIWYKSDYADAVYYNRRGVTFITQGSGRNPYATDHWDIKAEQAGKKETLYRTLNNALQNGNF